MAKNLDKIIDIGGEEYQVNAVTADKVNQKLIINKIDINSQSTPIEFDGKEEKDLSVVPVEGGHFSGPIQVPDTPTIENESVLNYSDVVNVVLREFKNHSTLYAWNADVTQGTGQFEPITTGKSPDSISLVTGSENHLQDFADANCVNNYLSAYLYICTDTGNIYYGIYSETPTEAGSYPTPWRIARLADEAKNLVFTDGSQNTPYTAESLKTAFEDIDTTLQEIASTQETTDEAIEKLREDFNKAVDGTTTVTKSKELASQNGASSYTYEDISTALNDINDNLDDIKDGTTKVGKAATLTSSDGNTNYTTTDITNIKNSITNITNGTTKVGKATNLVSADGKTSYTAANITSINTEIANIKNGTTTVDQALQDSTGWQISTGYYRAKHNTSGINHIYIQSAEPTGVQNGDIWIKY